MKKLMELTWTGLRQAARLPRELTYEIWDGVRSERAPARLLPRQEEYVHPLDAPNERIHLHDGDQHA